jgi:hypothetical protein
MPLTEIETYICEDCRELFNSHPAANCWCGKCGRGHILCSACWNVHLLSAAQQDHYLASLAGA